MADKDRADSGTAEGARDAGTEGPAAGAGEDLGPSAGHLGRAGDPVEGAPRIDENSGENEGA